MPKQVVHGATLQCTFGAAPSNLVVVPVDRLNNGGLAAANIMDHLPMVNIMPFGMCSCPANPAVAAATAAALGALIPSACLPVTATPWTPGAPTVMLANFPALDDLSKLICSYGGVITITFPGQETTDIP